MCRTWPAAYGALRAGADIFEFQAGDSRYATSWDGFRRRGRARLSFPTQTLDAPNVFGPQTPPTSSRSPKPQREVRLLGPRDGSTPAKRFQDPRRFGRIARAFGQ